MQGQPPKEWKVFRSGPDSYRAYVLDGGRWTPHREPEGLEFTVRPGMPLALAEAVDILNAAATLTRHRVMAALSGPGVPAEIDGQQCLRFGAHLEEGSFHWITFYLATGHFARITSSGPGGGSQVTLTQVGEPVEISDPAD